MNAGKRKFRDLVYRRSSAFIGVFLLLALYWPGLTNWFYQDDFGWLRLRQDVHSVRDLGPALFAPKAHGNMRPLGENAYWLGLSTAFGPEALPFRIVAFGTQIAALLLLGSIVLRLTGSQIAAVCAEVVWVANSGLAPALAWSSIYNQILSGFFLLLAFYFLLRGWHLAHWAAFVLGLGALETNVVYPALAAAYAVMFARPLLKRIAPMFAVSAVYVWLHFHFAGAQGGQYAMHFEGAMPATFWTYWNWALGRAPLAVTIALTIAIAVFAGWRAAKRDFLPLFGLAWFAIVLAVYLPLRDHTMDYYLAAPTIGIAILGAAAAVRAPRWIGGAAIAAYLAFSIPAGWAITQWNHERSRRVADLVLGVAEVRHQNPGKLVLLDGIDTARFQSAIADLPFLALDIPHVYLLPGSEAQIDAPADLVSKFELPQGMVLAAIKAGRAVVWNPDRHDETAQFVPRADALWRPEPPRFINLGDSVYDEFLSGGWGRAAHGYRSMTGSGAVRMGGSKKPGERLYIGVFRTQPFRLTVHVNGAELPVELAHRDNELSLFQAQAPVAEWIDLAISTDVAGPVVFGYLEVK
jgi:hypothetical protein